MYCQHCGNPLPESEAVAEIDAEATADVAEQVTDSAVEIERIRADRDVAIAKIGAGVVDVERDTELAAAEARADALEEVLSPPEPEPGSEPVVVVADATAADDDGQADDDGNPPPEAEPEPMPEPAKSGGMSWY